MPPSRPSAPALAFLAEATADTAGWAAGTAVAAGAAGLVALVAVRLARALLGAHPALTALARRSAWPAALLAAAGAVRARLEVTPLAEGDRAAWAQVASVVTIGAAAWLVTRALDVFEGTLIGRFDVSGPDNLRARARRTQVSVLRRVAGVAVVVVAAIVMLRSFTWGREIGTSLLAAGGIVGAVAGICGRSTIGNVIAGLQIAFAEPIRLDDVVVVEGEWGNIEEITLTYVVVRVWDQRRLVLPSSYFVEQPFQNWTRERAEIIGAVELWVDYSVPIAAMRAELDQLVAASPKWDGRVVNLQVTDASPHAVKVRALVSAADGPAAWDLRCEVREGLVTWMARHGPGALPTLRTAPTPGAPPGDAPPGPGTTTGGRP